MSGRRFRVGLVFVLFLALLLLTWPGWRSIFDADCMIAVTHALLLDHSVLITYPKYGGRGPSVYGLGQSLLFVPAVLAANWLGPPDEAAVRRLEFLLASLTNPLVVALLGATMFAASSTLFGLSTPRALLLAALCAFGTPLWGLTQCQMSEPLTALGLLVAALGTQARGSIRRHFLVGAVFGVAVLARPVELLLLPAIALGWLCDAWWSRAHLTWKDCAGRIAAWALGFAPMAATHLAYNAARFGSMWIMGYTGGPNVMYEARAGMAKGIETLLWSRRVGLLWFAPIVALALLCLPLLVRSRSVAGIIALAAFVLQLLVHARSGVLYGGPFWGPRYLVPIMPLALLGLIPALKSNLVARMGVILLGAYSVMVNGLGVIRDTGNTSRRLPLWQDMIQLQLSLLTPGDLAFPATRSASGTFWPAFTPFGVALLLVIGLSTIALAYSSGRLRWAHLSFWVILPLLFYTARERSIPYKVLRPRAFPVAQTTPLPLAEATSVRGSVHISGDGLSWGKGGRAQIALKLRRGIYRFRVRLEAGSQVSYSVSWMRDDVASGSLAADEKRIIETLPVRVRRPGTYAIYVGMYPQEVMSPIRSRALLCRSVDMEKLVAAGR